MRVSDSGPACRIETGLTNRLGMTKEKPIHSSRTHLIMVETFIVRDPLRPREDAREPDAARSQAHSVWLGWLEHVQDPTSPHVLGVNVSRHGQQ